MSDKKKLTAEKVASVLSYDPLTGKFHWKCRDGGYPQWNARFAGKEAGSLTSVPHADKQYVSIRIFRVPFQAHCLAWLLMNGSWCDADIDHIDGDGTNNSWKNLRRASKAQNLQNRGKNKNNTSGYKGVWLKKGCGRWVAEITANGRRRRLGYFPTAQEAALAYEAAAKKMHGDFARV